MQPSRVGAKQLTATVLRSTMLPTLRSKGELTMARLGVALGGGLSPTEIVDCVKIAEELGYESAWVVEGHGGDQFSILTACAVQTKTIRLGTAISSVFVRSAPTIAMAAACVDYFSNQRFILGLGSSHKVQVEPEHGITYAKPVQKIRDTVAIIRTLLRDGVVSYNGETTSIERFDLWFTPIRRELPIYISAVFPQMLEVSGEIAQGAIMVWSNQESGRKAAEHIALGARRAGRDPQDIDIVSLLSCSMSHDRREAFDRMRPAAAFYAGFFPRYNRLMAESGFPDAARAIREVWSKGDREGAAKLVPDALIQALGVAGTPAECRERIEAYRQSGIALPILFPLGSGTNAKQQVMDTLRACAP
ncbi:MAG TPA: LLM class flavin-dependent oxidoreductase [Methylomirabilota bacterium]|nr:LLM class flavin-dependent oxidoreductase [Methylomirabilota bacterium]